MAIDFRLTARQRELQLQSRKFAREVLAPAIEAETLPTPEQRFAATRPAYEAMIAAGFLRKCIPLSAGGESAGLTDTAIMVEELYAVNASVTLTLIGTVLGLSAAPDRRHGRAARAAAASVPETNRSAAGWVLRHRTGRQRQRSIASAGRGRTHHGDALRATAGSSMVEKAGFRRPPAGIARARTFSAVLCRTDPDAPPDRGISVILVERPASGLVFERAIDSVGHRAHLLPQFRSRGRQRPEHNCFGRRSAAAWL